MVCSFSDPVINPLNHLLRQNFQPKNRFEWVTIALLVLVEFLKIICISFMALGALMPKGYLLLYVLADLIIQPCSLLFYAIIIRVLLSYANPGLNNPAVDFLKTITAPLLKFGLRIIPNTYGFDFSPFVMLIILKITTLFISNSLPLRLL
jgi:YggT family protein